MTAFTCDCTKGASFGSGSCKEHSIVVTDNGLRMVTREQHLRFYGIPDIKNQAKAQLWLAGMGGDPKVKWADGTIIETGGN